MLTALLAGCANISHNQVASDEATVVMGPAVRDNSTPLDTSYACYADVLQSRDLRLSIGVGDIRDYTGKISDFEGTVVTQGGALMAYSALGKLGNAVQIHERFDTRVAELELAYSDNRRLGDGEVYEVDGRQVPWMPYFGGTILKSEYYIVGGITEVNYNIQSGGAQGTIDLIGPRARVFTMNVGVDLRLVKTDSLVVEATSSLQKQITGYEVEFEIFRFFDTTLVDFNAGMKNQEPVQLGVRTTVELAILDLLQQVTGQKYDDCVADYFLDPVVAPYDPPGPATGPGGKTGDSTTQAPGEDAQIETDEPSLAATDMSAERDETAAEQADAGAELTDDAASQDGEQGWLAGLFAADDQAAEDSGQIAPAAAETSAIQEAPAISVESADPYAPAGADMAAEWRELAIAWRELALTREAARLGTPPKVTPEHEIAAMQWQPKE